MKQLSLDDLIAREAIPILCRFVQYLQRRRRQGDCLTR